MTVYRCFVADADGRTAWRHVDAASEQAAIALLSADGSMLLEIRSGHRGLVERLNQPILIAARPGLAERALIMRQLALLIAAGLPVDRSLDLLREQATSNRQRQLCTDLLLRVRAGSSLAGAIAETRVFAPYVTGVIRSAEMTGQLGPAMQTLSDQLTRSNMVRAQLVTSLAYPAAVFIGAIAALLIILFAVIPQFEALFEGQEARLPDLTRAVLALSALAREQGWLLLGGSVAAGLLGFALARWLASSAAGGGARRYVPGMKLRDQYLAGEVSGLLALLLTNGVRVVDALPLARDAIVSRRWRQHLAATETAVREGGRLSTALAADAIFPVAAVRLIEVGERSGQLAETFTRASEIISDAVRAKVDRFVALANPIAIVTLGGIVAMLVAGVMLGIFALGDFAG